ncbi:MAG: hypothetical protein LVT47_09330 [Cyanobacteria bacterium LVE1205-1]
MSVLSLLMPYGDFLFSTRVKYLLAFRGGFSIAIAASPVSDPNLVD